MSQFPNPHVPPIHSPPEDPAVVEPTIRRESLEFAQMVRYMFQNPNWFMNLLFAAICQLIPVIGPIVFLGYQFEVIEMLFRYPQSRYPDFDFNNFVDYLKRGVWPFLVALVCGVVLVPVLIAMWIGFAVAIGVAGNGQASGLAIPLMVLLFAMFFVVILLAQMIIIPLQLRAGLAQDFATAFDFSFIKQFMRMLWKEVVIGWLFLALVGVACSVVGVVLCFVGIYFTLAIAMMAQAHFLYQLYEIFVTRGGPQIPLQPLARPAKGSPNM